VGIAVIAVGYGLWFDLQSGFSLLRGTSFLRGVIGIIGLGLLAVATEMTGESIVARDKTSDPLPRRGGHFILLVGAVAFWLTVFWLWQRALGLAQ